MAVEDLYWNPVDFGSDETIPHSSKQYIDPWDLENYAYIREHLEPTATEASSSGPSSLEEPTDATSFYYIPTIRARDPGWHDRYDSLTTDRTASNNYAAIDDFSLNKFGHSRNSRVNAQRYHYGGCLESGVEDTAFDESNRDSSLLYIYETRGRCRKMALPSSKISRERSMSFSYGDCGYDIYTHKQNIYSRLDDIYVQSDRMSTTQSAYDDVRKIRKPNNFGLSNYGHLKIDYSSSWNNLDEYIHK